MTTFYVASNGLHTTVVASNSEENNEIREISLDEALAIAKQKFTTAGIDTAGLSITRVIDEDYASSYGWGNGPKDIGLTEGAFIRAVEGMLGNEVCVDDDAEVSGFNLMTWCHGEPNDVMYHLASTEPVANLRDQPSRSETSEIVQLAAQRALDAFKAYQLNPSGTALDLLTEVMSTLEGTLDTRRDPSKVLSTVIQSWEATECPDDFASLSDDGRKPWKIEIEQTSANQVAVALWPASADMGEAQLGFGLLIEVDKGIPTVHVAPGPHQDNCCHVRQEVSGKVRVTAGTSFPVGLMNDGSLSSCIFVNGSLHA